MKQIIVKKPDGGIVIISPNHDKYENERREIFKDIEVLTSIPDPDNKGKFIEGKKMKTVLDRVIKPFSEEKALQKYIDPNHPDFVGVVHEWFIADEKPSKTDLESRKQLYHDGTNEVKKDLNWEVRLMPDQLIKKKYLGKLEVEIDDELAKENPDLTNVFKMQRNFEKCKTVKASNQNTDLFWIEKAIDGLDKKVAKGEGDKTVIREKLIAKKAELDGK